MDGPRWTLTFLLEKTDCCHNCHSIFWNLIILPFQIGNDYDFIELEYDEDEDFQDKSVKVEEKQTTTGKHQQQQQQLLDRCFLIRLATIEI